MKARQDLATSQRSPFYETKQKKNKPGQLVGVHLSCSRWHCGTTLTHKVPNKYSLLEKTGGLEAVMKELLQSSHEAVFSAQQDRQAASLQRQNQETSVEEPGTGVDVLSSCSYLTRFECRVELERTSAGLC